MIIAQTILRPIVVACRRAGAGRLHDEYSEQVSARSVSAAGRPSRFSLVGMARYSLLTVGLAAFGRAVAEVGPVIIGRWQHRPSDPGHDHRHLARRPLKGDLALELALGIVLLVISLGVNAAVHTLRLTAMRQPHV